MKMFDIAEQSWTEDSKGEQRSRTLTDIEKTAAPCTQLVLTLMLLFTMLFKANGAAAKQSNCQSQIIFFFFIKLFFLYPPPPLVEDIFLIWLWYTST